MLLIVCDPASEERYVLKDRKIKVVKDRKMKVVRIFLNLFLRSLYNP